MIDIISNKSKKRIKGPVKVLIFSALILTLLPVFVLGADLSEMIKVYRNHVILKVDNTVISTDNFLYNGTTYAPIRAVAQMLGKQVDWDSITKVASITDIDSQYEPQVTETMNLTLYFPDNDAQFVWAEERSVMVYDNATARASITALISGTESDGFSSSIPTGTMLLNIDILNEICTVNFSKEFVDNHWGGSAGEGLTLASIVNTLTEFPTIQKVMILVEGKAGATLGNMLLDHALGRMTDMIGQ